MKEWLDNDKTLNNNNNNFITRFEAKSSCFDKYKYFFLFLDKLFQNQPTDCEIFF